MDAVIIKIKHNKTLEIRCFKIEIKTNRLF